MPGTPNPFTKPFKPTQLVAGIRHAFVLYRSFAPLSVSWRRLELSWREKSRLAI
jgi:hypothetical protein